VGFVFSFQPHFISSKGEEIKMGLVGKLIRPLADLPRTPGAVYVSETPFL